MLTILLEIISVDESHMKKALITLKLQLYTLPKFPIIFRLFLRILCFNIPCMLFKYTQSIAYNIILL